MPKHDLSIDPPIMNAAGSLGFSPDLHGGVDWRSLGAFVTNPISLLPRTPANGRRYAAFAGGFLLHTGYPNPGFDKALRLYARHWSRSPIPVVVHLLASAAAELSTMTRRLEMVEGIVGLEIGVSSEASPEQVVALARAASGELPVIVRLPMERAAALARHAIEAGASAISLAPPRGAYPVEAGPLLEGRMYGPAILPLALKAVKELAMAGIPVIGAGGVYTREHCEAMRVAGARAVQVDSALWLSGGNRLFT